MHKFCAILVAGSALATTSAAFAQKATPAANFEGPRIEALIGYDNHRSGSSADFDDDLDLKQSIDGVTYGAGIGYDFAIGDQMIIGAEAEITDSSAGWDNNNSQPNVFNLGRVNAGRDIYVGGRIGYAASPTTLLYAKAGYTNARYNVQGTDGSTSLNEHLDTDGYRIGAGVEHKLGTNAFVKLEYRYSNYSEGEIDFARDIPDSSRFDIDTDRHQVVAGVGYRF
ncbi:MAG: porin family protein [Novosphingobium sp.]